MPTPIERILFVAMSALADEAERSELLARACEGDSDLRRRVERIYSSQKAAADFFELEPGIPFASEDASGSSQALGGRIGRYRLIQRLGEGGYGVVYLAEQLEPVRRKVALKIIRLGMDTERVIARFELERQALAMMDHPNIAQVLDAGTTVSGRPYFVMELVEGEPITAYCDSHRMNIRQRLEVFMKVCQAIQHAHVKGLIHRDIKPSNVLVTYHDGIPVPKVIDFGIAKAATKGAGDDVDLTAVDQFIGTPAYMSPEIAAGVPDLDTRTDIHSLGGILYELLTGRAPFDPGRLRDLSMGEIRQILRDEEPPAPSTLLGELPENRLDDVAAWRNTRGLHLRAEVKRDLDWIAMKSLNRNRDDRYQSAYGLALDVERYLRGEPVQAGPPDRLYALTKFVGRNKLPIMLGAVILAVLGAGFGVSTWLFLREKAARNEQEILRMAAIEARENESVLRRKAEFREVVARAAVQIGYGQYAEADQLLRSVPVDGAPPSLEAARSNSSVGDWHVQAGRWKEATDRFTAAALALASVDPSDSDALSIAFIPAAATLTQAGDRVRYNAVRTSAISRFKDTSNLIVAEQVLKSALLMPADETTLKALEPLADLLVKGLNNRAEGLADNPSRIAWTAFALALSEYRLGNFQSASEWAERCLVGIGENPSRDASLCCLRGMIAWRLGDAVRATELLDQAETLIGQIFSQPIQIGNQQSFWFDWVNARNLLREANVLTRR